MNTNYETRNYSLWRHLSWVQIFLSALRCVSMFMNLYAHETADKIVQQTETFLRYKDNYRQGKRYRL